MSFSDFTNAIILFTASCGPWYITHVAACSVQIEDCIVHCRMVLGMDVRRGLDSRRCALEWPGTNVYWYRLNGHSRPGPSHLMLADSMYYVGSVSEHISLCYGVQCGERIRCESTRVVIGLVWSCSEMPSRVEREKRKNWAEERGREWGGRAGRRKRDAGAWGAVAGWGSKVSMTKDKRIRWKNRQLWGHFELFTWQTLTLLNIRRFLTWRDRAMWERQLITLRLIIIELGSCYCNKDVV
jgi:hypothetical protein